jgi:hypothetical protein
MTGIAKIPANTADDLRRIMAQLSAKLGKKRAADIIQAAFPINSATRKLLRPNEMDPAQIADLYAMIELEVELAPDTGMKVSNVVPFPKERPEDYTAFREGMTKTNEGQWSPPSDELPLAEQDRLRQMIPLDIVRQYDPCQPVKGVKDICNRWVWITGLKLWVRRTDTTQQWDKEQFDSEYNPFVDGSSICKALFKDKRRAIHRFDRFTFRPNKPEFVGHDYNAWRPSPIVAAEGDTSLWDNHLEYLIPNKSDRNKLLDWLAGIVQQQGVKPMHALFLWGRIPGTGKSFIFEVLQRLCGEPNCQVLTQDILASGFTGWAMRTKLVVVEEIRTLETKHIKHTIHPWITQKNITVHDKHIRSAKMDNVLAFGLMSNKGDYPLDNNDRRYLVIETPAVVHPDGIGYYEPLYELLDDPTALGAIKWQLEHHTLAKGYKITGNAPATDAKAEMMVAGRNDIETWLHEHKPTSELVTLDDVMEGMPTSLKRAGLYNTVREFIKEACGGVPLGEHRLDGRNGTRVSLWAVNADELPPDQWAAAVKGWTAMEPKWRARRYLKSADSKSAEEAQGDFAE